VLKNPLDSMKIRLAYLISAINNGIKSRTFSVNVPYSSLNYEVLELLLKCNLICSFSFQGNSFTVVLRYYNGQSVIKRLNLISRLKRHIYMDKSTLQNTTRTGNISGFYILSTSGGLVTHFESLNLESNLSGEVILRVVL